MKKVILSILMLLMMSSVHAQLRIFSCEPEWTSLLKELGGDKASIYTATNAFQDPHHIEARPSLIARLRRADLLVCTGAGLEAGWLPLLVRQAANANIQPGKTAYFEAALQVKRLAVPQYIDRSLGDIHAQGNPHVHLSPDNIQIIAKALTQRLSEIDKDNAQYFQQHSDAFLQRWQTAMQRWRDTAKPLQGIRLVTHHKDWIYLLDWLKLREVATLEPKPGIPPSAGHLARLKSELQNTKPQAVIYTPYQSSKAAKWLAGELDIPALKLPYTVGSDKKTEDLFSLFDEIIRLLLSSTTHE